MLQIVSRVLLLCAACLGTIPADKCLLMLAGDCCGESHVIQVSCDAHHHSDADDDEQTSPDCDHHHHSSCVVLSADSLTLPTQHAPTLDVRQDQAPQRLLCVSRMGIDSGSGGTLAFDPTHLRGGRPPDAELFLRTHSYLI